MLNDLVPQAAAVYGVVGAAWAALMPTVVARLPEPAEPDDDKPLYAELAGTSRLRWYYAAWGLLVGAALGAVLGFSPSLLLLLPMVPWGIALGHIDLRTRLLPKKLVLPAYPVVLVLIATLAVVLGEASVVRAAAVGWLVASALYWVLWRFTNSMGYGDVRLAGVIGLALGAMGLAELGYGLYAGFVLAVLGWVPLRLLRITTDRHLPFGPFIFGGALIGAVAPTLLR